MLSKENEQGSYRVTRKYFTLLYEVLHKKKKKSFAQKCIICDDENDDDGACIQQRCIIINT